MEEEPPKVKRLLVATLNYGGILNNPFEFYSDEHQELLRKLSECFKSLFSKYMPTLDSTKKFDWKMGNVDKLLRNGRYSPLFHGDIGLNEDKTAFLTQKKFEENWNDAFSKLEKPFDYEEIQVGITRMFDFIVFHALLKYVYAPEEDADFEQLIKNDPAKYIATYAPLYQMSYLDEKSKLLKFTSSVEKMEADVLLLQEHSAVVEEYFHKHEEYWCAVDHQKDSMIVTRKS